MRWPFVLLSSFLCLWDASGQMSTLAGTSLTIVEGTSLRIDTPLNWVLESGSATINNGTVELGPGTELLEAPGAAITGSGTERTVRTYSVPLSAVDAGGLGGTVTTEQSPGILEVVRGHIPYVDYSGHASIARWIDFNPTNNNGLNATLSFRYDTQELNGLSETSQVLHQAQGNDVWGFLASTVNTVDRTVTTTGLNSLGTFTTFDQDLPNAINDQASLPGFSLFGAEGGQPFLIVPSSETVEFAEIMTTAGKVIQAWSPKWATGQHEIPVRSVSAGFYLLRLNHRTVLNFVQP